MVRKTTSNVGRGDMDVELKPMKDNDFSLHNGYRSKLTSPKEGQEQHRTEIPNDFMHIKTLVLHSLHKDMKQGSKSRNVFVIGMLLIFLFIGTVFSGGGRSSVEKYYPGEPLLFPETIFVGGKNGELVISVSNVLHHVHTASQEGQPPQQQESDVTTTTDRTPPFDVSIISSNTLLSTTLLDDGTGTKGATDTESYNEDQLLMAMFKSYCNKHITGSNRGKHYFNSHAKVCVYIQSSDAYTIYYIGEYWILARALASTQDLINNALLYITFQNTNDNNSSGDNITKLLPKTNRIVNIQKVPTKMITDKNKKTISSDRGWGFGKCHILVFLCVLLFAITWPISLDLLIGIPQSYLNVGVKLSSYLLHWIIYIAVIHGSIVCAIITIISICWELYPQSDFLLLYISHYFGYIATMSQFVFMMFYVNFNEHGKKKSELLNHFPMLLVAINSGIGLYFSIYSSAKSMILTVLGVFSPLSGIIQYNAIYATYDYSGNNTGIHLFDRTFIESGLSSNMVAQIVSIMVWISVILLFANQKFCPFHERQRGVCCRSRKGSNDKSKSDMVPLLQNATEAESTSKFINENSNDTNGLNIEESHSSSAEVLLSVRGLQHEYYPELSYDDKLEKKTKKPIEVVKNLSIDIYHDEAFVYFGPTGAGKTTLMNILSGEVKRRHGHVTYHFRDNFLEKVRTKVGIDSQNTISMFIQNEKTVKETLKLYATLRGGILKRSATQTLEDAIEDEVNRRLEEMNLTTKEEVEKPLKIASDVTKRKLRIAIALLGDPEIVFIDEPTGGLDTSDRRTIWDMIIAAKKGRCVVLATHLLDEAEALSDRIGIMADGNILACGSAPFLKEYFGDNYEVAVDSAKTTHKKQLPSSSSNKKKSELDHEEGEGKSKSRSDETNDKDLEDVVERIWRKKHQIFQDLSIFWKKIYILQHIIMTSVWKSRAIVGTNIAIMVYLLFCIVSENGLVGINDHKFDTSGPIHLYPNLMDEDHTYNSLRFFGAPSELSIRPYEFTNEPDSSDYYFSSKKEGLTSVVGGYYSGNQTLQYAPDVSPFALQICIQLLANVTATVHSQMGTTTVSSMLSPPAGISASIQLIASKSSESSSRASFAILPLYIIGGLSGMAISRHEIGMLKTDKINGLFRVAGITEWMSYLGLAGYKIFMAMPFFLVIVLLGFSLQMVLFGDAGRWIATLLVLITFAYSAIPMGIIVAKLSFGTDSRQKTGGISAGFECAFHIITTISYIPWAIAFRIAAESTGTDGQSFQNKILLLGDVLCIFPQFAAQRGLGLIIHASTKYQDDENLPFGDIWKFHNRVGLSLWMMFMIGTLEWLYLRRLCLSSQVSTKEN